MNYSELQRTLSEITERIPSIRALDEISGQIKLLKYFSNEIANTALFDFYRKDKLLCDFADKLLNKSRYFCQDELFDELDGLLKKYVVKINAGETIFRARKARRGELNSNYREEAEINFNGFNKADSFVPPRSKIKVSRAMPSGIPCLYAAKDKRTAIAEVRPYAGSCVSVAEIRVNTDLTLVNLYYDMHISLSKIKRPMLWLRVANLFARPNEEYEDDYIVTQCISEYIKTFCEFDGIQYNSSLDDKGVNLALFNCEYGDYDVCEPVASDIYHVDKIGFQASNASNEECITTDFDLA